MLSEISSTISTIQLIKMMNTCIAHINSVRLQSMGQVNMPSETVGGPAAVLGAQPGPALPVLTDSSSPVTLASLRQGGYKGW